VNFGALVGLALPSQLTALGYDVVKIGTSERVTGAGLARVEQYLAATCANVGGYWPK
jgi:hypothetical protein